MCIRDRATAVQATALGYKSEASVKDGVALGSTSKATVDKGVKGFNPAEDRDNKYGGLAGTAQTSTSVSYTHLISKDDRRLYGAHLFYDHRFLRHHNRLSGGLEYMSGESEFRFNWYGSASDERILDANLHTLERVANGYTLEYGKTFKNARWARVYVEGYHWNQERQADKNGLRVGSDVYKRQSLHALRC